MKDYSKNTDVSSFLAKLVLLSIGGIGFLIFLAAAYVYGVFTAGFVISKFWLWFVLPLFPSLPVVSVWQGVGLSYLVSAIAPKQFDVIKHKETEIDGAKVFTYLIMPWFVLLAGFLLKVFFL